MRLRRREREPKPALRLRPVLVRIGDGLRYDWQVLLIGGLAVFAPITLIGAFDLIGEADISGIGAGLLIAEAGLIFLQLLLPMLGNVLYAGIAAAGEEERRHGVRRSIVSIARSLPYFTLVLVDLLLVLALVLGLILLIIPGVVMMVWFSLVAPVVELEHKRAIASFRRSFRLVKPHFWKVAGLVIPITIVQATLAMVGDEVGHALLGASFAGDWAGSIAASLLSSPIWALTVLALYHQLAEISGGPETPVDGSSA